MLCPKLRYNVGDEGQIWQYRDLLFFLALRDIKGMTPSEFRLQADHRFGRDL